MTTPKLSLNLGPPHLVSPKEKTMESDGSPWTPQFTPDHV